MVIPTSKPVMCILQAFEDMAVLKAQSDKEQTTFEAEWRQLTKLIEADRRSRVRLWTACHSCVAPAVAHAVHI